MVLFGVGVCLLSRLNLSPSSLAVGARLHRCLGDLVWWWEYFSLVARICSLPPWRWEPASSVAWMFLVGGGSTSLWSAEFASFLLGGGVGVGLHCRRVVLVQYGPDVGHSWSSLRSVSKLGSSFHNLTNCAWFVFEMALSITNPVEQNKLQEEISKMSPELQFLFDNAEVPPALQAENFRSGHPHSGCVCKD